MPGEYIERVSNHAYNNQLKNCLAALEQIQELVDESNDEALEHLERINKMFDLFQHKMQIADPYLISIHTLNEFNSILQNTFNHLNNYRNDRNDNRLLNANNELDKIIPILNSIAFPESIEDLDLARESVSSFRRSVGQLKRNAEADGELIQQLKVDLEGEITDLSGFIKEEKEELESYFEQKNQEINNLIESFQKDFTTHQDERSNYFETEKQKWEEKYEEHEETVKSDRVNFHEQLNDKKKEFEKELDRKKEKLEELFNLVTDGAISGAYHKAANDEKRLRNIWYWLTGVGFVGLITFSICVFVLQGIQLNNWAELARKIFLTGAVGAFVSYAAKQASDHKAEERANRAIELKMKSIDPYLDSLEDEEKKKEIKEKLVDPLFKENPVAATKDGKDIALFSLSDIQKILEMFKK